jgi:hypothetical protein
MGTFGGRVRNAAGEVVVPSTVQNRLAPPPMSMFRGGSLDERQRLLVVHPFKFSPDCRESHFSGKG